MAAATMDMDAPGGTLATAPVDGQDRWRALVAVTADLAFETDAFGRFVFVSPDPALGWGIEGLLGRSGDTVLTLPGAGGKQFDPFRVSAPVRGRRAWLRRADGSAVCLSFCAAPILDADGRVTGARGIGQDVTAQDKWDAAAAATLRRGEVMDQVLRRMRQEVMAPRMMRAALDALRDAIGAEGAAVVDLVGDGASPATLHQVGGPGLHTVLPTALLLLEQGQGGHDHPNGEPGVVLATHGLTADRRPVIACPNRTRFGEQSALVLWRGSGGRAWDADDAALATASTTLIQMVLEHEAIQREMARQARTDPLTNLLNRRAFLEEIARRIDRLDREGQPATLIFVDLDHFRQLNDASGHNAGDTALCIVAALLRDTVRPTDLVARLGGDEFALWLDGADELTAAERAESMRLHTPRALAHLLDGSFGPAALGMSIGIATRWPELGEDIEALMHRADSAMHEAKRAGRGQWKVSQLNRR